MKQTLALAFSMMLFIAPSLCFAGGEESNIGDLWVGLEMGAGNIHYDMGRSQTESSLQMNFKLGYVLFEQWLLGIELGGYSFEYSNYNDPSEGAAVSQAFLVLQYYLREGQEGWYVKGGGGWVNYWDHSPGARGESGLGTTLGIGHNWSTHGFGKIGPLVLFNSGQTDNYEHTAIAVALNWSSH